MPQKIIIFLLILGILTETLFAGDASKTIKCIIDDHKRPLPGQPPDGWFYNLVGGDRGFIHNLGVAEFSKPDDSSYQAKIRHLAGSNLWEFVGGWYAVGRGIADKFNLHPAAIYHPIIRSEYQPKVTGVEVKINDFRSPSGFSNPIFRIELKGFDPQGNEVVLISRSWSRSELVEAGGFPTTVSIHFDPDLLKGGIGLIVWVMDRAFPGDAIIIDDVVCVVEMPEFDPKTEAIVIRLGMLLNLYNPVTGMVDDRSNFPRGVFENVTATAKLAKIFAQAIEKNIVDPVLAVRVILKIADTFINTIPRGPVDVNRLLPHFTENGGRQIIIGTEWPSGDTAFAVLDLALALQMIGDPQDQLDDILDILRQINWDSLLSADGYFHHGYDFEGNLLPSTWSGFGVETHGVNLAAAVGTDNGIIGNMLPFPTDNGSGFIMHAGYPLVPAGLDINGNNWFPLRLAETQSQIAFYHSPQHFNAFFVANGLFGLSAAESPMGDSYQAYGIGGRTVSPNYRDADGNDVIVSHYTGMIAALQPEAAVSMWQSLTKLGLVTPLNNLESMAVNPDTGEIAALNALQGAWNLAIEVDGWLSADSAVAGAVYAAFRNIPELAKAHDVFFPPRVVPGDEGIILSRGGFLYEIAIDDARSETQFTTADDPFINPGHPVVVDDLWVWFDAVNEELSGLKRRGLWRISVDERRRVERRTTDPFGRSYDDFPVPSPFHSGVLYHTNRSGIDQLKYTQTGTQGPGFGRFVHSSAVAVWARPGRDEALAYLASSGVSRTSFDVYEFPDVDKVQSILWANDGSLSVRAQRLDISRDGGQLLLSTTGNEIYVKRLPNGDAVKVADGRDACFSPYGRHIAFVNIPDNQSDYELYIAAVEDSGTLSQPVQITENNLNDRHPTWFRRSADAVIVDFDSDGLSDEEEMEQNTDLANPDTDGDGIIDGDDPDPLIFTDNINPVIVVDPLEVTLEGNSSTPDLMAGVSATDNVDGDIRHRITVRGAVDTTILGNYVVMYDVTDTAGNAVDTVDRVYHVVDTQPPVLTVIPATTHVIDSIDNVNLHDGVRAFDVFEGDITDSIEITASTPADPNIQEIEYSVEDTSGNTDRVIRTYIISPDSDGDLLPDAWELEHFSHLCFDDENDPDGDGLSNLQEYDAFNNPYGFTLELHQGWNLIAVPRTGTVTELFGSETAAKISGRLWYWDAGTAGFQAADDVLEPMRGYWIFVISDIAGARSIQINLY